VCCTLWSMGIPPRSMFVRGGLVGNAFNSRSGLLSTICVLVRVLFYRDALLAPSSSGKTMVDLLSPSPEVSFFARRREVGAELSALLASLASAVTDEVLG
jgi:hypothetical protein